MRYSSSNWNANKIFFLQTANITNHSSSLIPPTTRIKSMYFNYPYCYPRAGLVCIQVSKETWQEESDTLSHYDGSVPIAARTEYRDPDQRANIIKNFKRVLLQILKYPWGKASEIELTSILFKNNSVIYSDSHARLLICDKGSSTLQNHRKRMTHFPPLDTGTLYTIIIYKTEVEPMLVSETDQFSFLSCGNTVQGKLDFFALFSAFDSTASLLIVASLIIWSTFFSLVENNFDIRKVISDIDGLILGLVTILEQGHRRVVNSKGKSALLFLGASSLLVNIVLSNAFKGNNIEMALAKLKPIPYTHFDQLLNNTFKIYSQIKLKQWGDEFEAVYPVIEFEAQMEKYTKNCNATNSKCNMEKLLRIERSLKIHRLAREIAYNETKRYFCGYNS